MIAVEDGPEGCFPDIFKKEWVYAMVTTDKTGNPWFRDMIRIMKQLHIVSNNGPSTIGGGGTPRQPLAPPFSGTTSVNTNSRKKLQRPVGGGVPAIPRI